VIIGLEIHAELSTRSKIFCSCSTAFGGEPNSRCCPVCLGLPGALPLLNETAVEYGILAGLALNCTISVESKFDRKNYFYPDLPKAYQISQYDQPLCRDGWVEFELEQELLHAGVTRVHLEEEAGKSIHSGDNILGSDYSSIDYNRAGIPLIEIVTEPDLRSPAQAKAFLEQLKRTLQYIDVSDCKMEEGSLRCDANISLRPQGGRAFGTKVEIKNLNSFRAVERALDHEVQRQRNVLETGAAVVQDTRAWNEAKGVTVSMRSKEESHDYRYFPEPDLPPLAVNQVWVEELRQSLPEMPLSKRNRIMEQYGLGRYASDFLANSAIWADFFECAAKQYGNYKVLCNWLMGDVSRVLNARQEELPQSRLTPAALVELLRLVDDEIISGSQAKDVLEEVCATGRSSKQVTADLGMEQISDEDELTAMVEEVLAAHPEQAQRCREGEERLVGYFVGQVMKLSRGQANPKRVNALLRQKLQQ